MIAEAPPFVMFGLDHMTAIALTALVALGLIGWSRRRHSPALTRRLAWAIAAVVVLNEIGTWIHSASVYGWQNLTNHMLPFHFCGIAVFLVAWTLIRPNWLVFELAYFWGLAATLMGVITPNVPVGFPSYDFVRFFLNHSGIVIGVLYATLAMGQRPRHWAVVRVFVLTHVLMALVAPINLLIGPGANYMFLRKAPGPLSIYFEAPWPWYILILEPIGLVMFSLLYVPFFVARRRQKAPLATPPDAPACGDPPAPPVDQ